MWTPVEFEGKVVEKLQQLQAGQGALMDGQLKLQTGQESLGSKRLHCPMEFLLVRVRSTQRAALGRFLTEKRHLRFVQSRQIRCS